MQLKHDLVRDILLTMESMEFGAKLTQTNYQKQPFLAECDLEDFTYTAIKLRDAGFVEIDYAPMSGNRVSVKVREITWSGHQFLDNIRDAKVWSETKKATSELASVSLHIVSEVASSLVKSALGLN